MKNMQNSPPQNRPRNPVANSNRTTVAQPGRRKQRSGLGCSLAFVLVLVGLGIAVAIGGPRLLAYVDRTGAVTLPVEDRTSPAALAERHHAEMAQLHSYGWVDQAAGVARIPITRAMALVAERGLPVGGATVANSSESTAGAPEKGSATADSAAAQPTADLANVSFQKDVLPIFMDHCAECHGADEPEEGLVLTSYKDVMAGSIYGAVVKPGEPENSYLVEMVATGQMPKRGDDLTQAQIDTIVAWIKAGAPDN